MPDYEIPAFLQNNSVDEVHKEMLDTLPDDIDKSEGQFVWDLTRPTALEVSQFAEFQMVEAVKMIFPQTAEGIYLNLHAENRGIVRKEATKATGTINLKGKVGTIVPKGSVFSTASVNGEPSIDFVTTAMNVIPDSGTIAIPIEAKEAGIIGNVPKDTIILKGSNITNLEAVNNDAATSGGTVEENDDNLRDRIVEYDKVQGVSFVGSSADYKRWATSVPGTGNATVISAQDNSGTVTIVLTDGNGEPASPELIQKVYNYIMSPDSPNERISPVNAKLTILPPVTIAVSVSATVQLTTVPLVTVKNDFIASLKQYLQTCGEDEEIRFQKVGTILNSTTGVYDFKDLTVNGGTTNIPISINELPVLDEAHVILTEIEEIDT